MIAQYGGRPVTDSRMKGRVKGLLGGTSRDHEVLDQTRILSDPGARRQALQVLALAQRTADEHVAAAQHQADNIRSDARANADALEREANQRYQDAVGGLAAKRAALQQQTEALQKSDRDYRSRLRTFMQSQLRALGVNEPPPSSAEIEQANSVSMPGSPTFDKPEPRQDNGVRYS